MAILGDQCVKRLSFVQILMEFTELLSSNNNFSNYRKVYHACTGFKIPILYVIKLVLVVFCII